MNRRTKHYYHASPKRFNIGTELKGGHDGGAGYAHENVCMTDSPVPHGSIVGNITNEWHVYEVRPLDRVGWCDGNEEYQTKRAIVTRYVGKAIGILNNAGPKARIYGSTVPPRNGRTKARLKGFNQSVNVRRFQMEAYDWMK